MQPPLVVELDGGVLQIVFGHRRVQGAIAAGLATITVLVGRAETAANGMSALAENVVRAQIGPVDQWRAIERLEALGWTEEAIATALALPPRSVRKLKLLGPHPSADARAHGPRRDAARERASG